MESNSTLLIYNATIVYSETCEYHKDAALLIKNSKIAKIFFNKSDWIDQVENTNIQALDAKGGILGPGFVDMHFHGCGGYDTNSDNKEEALLHMVKTLKNKGITTFQPTIHYDLSSIKKLAKAINNNKELQNHISGLYIEGPFINLIKKGGLSAASIREPDIKVLNELLDIKINDKCAVQTMTVAPELENVDPIIDILNKNNILIGFGHSDAKITDVPQLKKYHFTHLFNAMNGINHKNPGLAMFPFLYKNEVDITCEMIGDGVHIDYNTLKFTFNCLNENQVCLISDSMLFTTLVSKGPMIYVGKEAYCDGRACYYCDDNTLIGSCNLTIDTAKILLEKNIITKELFFKIGAVNPARALKLINKGSIEVGNIADLILLNSEYKVIKVFKS